MAKRQHGVVIDWLFRDRTTGRITVAQFPNAALGLFLAAKAFEWLFAPAGAVRDGLELLATASLIWWAVDEVGRGVNPWRRILGGAVLAGQIVNWVRH